MGDGRLREGRGQRAEIPAQLVLLAMGFLGPQRGAARRSSASSSTPRANVARDDAYMTSCPGVFVAGDAGRGQSLIVWAIAEGRSAAHGVDAWLMGKPSRCRARSTRPTARCSL